MFNAEYFMNWELKRFLEAFCDLSIDMQKQMFTTKVIIKKGTLLYRIRKDDGSDLLSPSAWGLAPKDKVKQGRFNKANEPVLYVSTDNIILGRELELKDNEVYYEAVYKCKNDFELGTLFTDLDELSNVLHRVSMSVDRVSCLSKDELEIVEKYKKEGFIVNKLSSIAKFGLASFYIHDFVDNLYDYTNKIGYAAMNENGLRYSSVYIPFERQEKNCIFTVGDIEEGNMVLTEKGIQNIEFIKAEKKVYHNKVNLCNYLEICKNI